MLGCTSVGGALPLKRSTLPARNVAGKHRCSAHGLVGLFCLPSMLLRVLLCILPLLTHLLLCIQISLLLQMCLVLVKLLLILKVLTLLILTHKELLLALRQLTLWP